MRLTWEETSRCSASLPNTPTGFAARASSIADASVAQIREAEGEASAKPVGEAIAEAITGAIGKRITAGAIDEAAVWQQNSTWMLRIHCSFSQCM